jgi:hypothetical protein
MTDRRHAQLIIAFLRPAFVSTKYTQERNLASDA